MTVNAWVYILECADGSFYVGSTVDLERRVWQHQVGEGATYTKRRGRRPVELVYVEEFEQITDAFAREKQIQRWGRAKRIALIDHRYDDLPELAERCSTRRRRKRLADLDGMND
ncbi:GIY-YIG nuclease family protein [Nocardioides sp. C4-1]|uniref:GIY-YIG nuclease family protein n=1 Tax=Nocardioides sp. C4-1 TaxID=3151851 RepID=UPI0032668729